ncbi:hypothetical protein RHODOSMS8_02442 [Rhodobiaceae bacterium]|nr:hypothetical protein RHODOSMS8_02442 [Rhodobiaceae bacterium]
MLQINSGKLFTREVGRQNELRGIIYTNLRLGRDGPIETAMGRLQPTSTLREAKAVVYELTERIEAEEKGPGVLVSHGMEPYIQDFSAVLSFALNVVSTPDYDLASRMTSGKGTLSVATPPDKLVRRVFDNEVWCKPQDEELLIALAQDLIALERKSYLAAMRAIRTYVTGLHRLSDDLELAYTMLVASIESLVQEFDGHETVWSDYDETKRRKIDRVLNKYEPAIGARVREVLLEQEHVSLARRFREYVLSTVSSSYFREEALGQPGPISRAELPGALRQAYNLRSQYVHKLKELPKELTLDRQYGEVVQISGNSVLSFQGLTRLVRHVIRRFVETQPKTDCEPYDYLMEKSGIMSMQMAAQYWIWRSEGLTIQHGMRRLEGFLEQLLPVIQGQEGAALTDLREMLAKAESLFDVSTSVERRPFLALYFLFNHFLSSNEKMDSFEKIRGKYLAELEDPSVVSMFVHLLFGLVPTWSLSSHQDVLDTYFRERNKKNKLRVPQLLETAAILFLAERIRIADQPTALEKQVAAAVENSPGNRALLELEAHLDPVEPIDWRQLLFPQQKAVDE